MIISLEADFVLSARLFIFDGLGKEIQELEEARIVDNSLNNYII